MSSVGISIPVFLTAIMLMYVFHRAWLAAFLRAGRDRQRARLGIWLLYH